MSKLWIKNKFTVKGGDTVANVMKNVIMTFQINLVNLALNQSDECRTLDAKFYNGHSDNKMNITYHKWTFSVLSEVHLLKHPSD